MFLLLAGSLNNDTLSVCLAFAVIALTLRWRERPTAGNILLLAAALGLAMETKVSNALFAVPLAALFLVRLVKWLRDRDLGKSRKIRKIAQFAAFGAVSVPLGMWWSVRNYLRYGTPFGYVPTAASIMSPQYIGYFGLRERLFFFQVVRPFVAMPGEMGALEAGELPEHGIALASLKYSLFGEWRLAERGSATYILASALFWVNLALAAAATVLLLIRLLQALRRRRDSGVLFLSLLSVTLLVSQVVFCIEYPHVCSQDFRYIVPTLLCGACFLGRALQDLPARRRALLIAPVLLFCALSPAVWLSYLLR